MITVSGIALISLSVKVSLPRKNLKVRGKREKVTPVFVENIPIYPKDDTMESMHLKVKFDNSSESK